MAFFSHRPTDTEMILRRRGLSHIGAVSQILPTVAPPGLGLYRSSSLEIQWLEFVHKGRWLVFGNHWKNTGDSSLLVFMLPKAFFSHRGVGSHLCRMLQKSTSSVPSSVVEITHSYHYCKVDFSYLMWYIYVVICALLSLCQLSLLSVWPSVCRDHLNQRLLLVVDFFSSFFDKGGEWNSCLPFGQWAIVILNVLIKAHQVVFLIPGPKQQACFARFNKQAGLKSAWIQLPVFHDVVNANGSRDLPLYRC